MSIYDGQFRGNVLVVGRTGYGKTYFLQKLGLHNFFGNIVKAEWVSDIEISESREAEIQSCLDNKIEFYPVSNADELKKLIKTFKLGTEGLIEQDYVNINETVYGEKRIVNRLVVMDDVSGIANSCKECSDFLTVSRKHRYHCVYVFQIIIPEKEIWKKIISQTNIFNIFPCSVLYNTVSKILQSNCAPTTTKYVPVRSMWLTRVFFELTNRDERSCLTIDCTTINKNGPSRYRTKADNPVEQLCYFNDNPVEQLCYFSEPILISSSANA